MEVVKVKIKKRKVAWNTFSLSKENILLGRHPIGIIRGEIFTKKYKLEESSIVEGVQCPIESKVKVVPYTFVRRGVLVREDTYVEPSACEVGWPVPSSIDSMGTKTI